MKQKFIKTLFFGGIATLGSLNVFGQGTTASHDFNDNVVPTAWRAGQGFFITAAEQRLKVKVAKQRWEEFSYDLPLNLTAAPKVSFKVRGDNYFQLVLALVTTEKDADGNTVSKDNRFQTPLLATIFPNKEFIDVSYDFTDFLAASGTDAGNLDLSKVTSIRFMVDPACEKSVNLEIDDFKVGSAALSFPRMIAPITQNAYLNQAATNVLLRGLTAGSTVTATSSNPALIPNPTVGAIGTNGIANLVYTPVVNQSGTVKITVKVSKAGLSDLIFPFDVTVNSNIAPTIDPIANQTVGSNQTLAIPLSGISDGNTSRQQVVTITGKSSDQTVIRDADITLVYTNPMTNGQITFKTLTVANGSKTVNIIITLADDGGTEGGGVNTKTVTIPITVYASYYKSPEIAKITNNNFAYIGTTYTTTLTGINDGNGGSKVTTVTAVSSNQSAVPNPVVNYVAGSNTATISYKAQNKELSTITVSVTNTGAPANSNGNSTTTTTFTVKGIDLPYTGYIEDFQSWGVDGKTASPNVLGGDYFSSGTGGDDRVAWMTSLDGYEQKWFVEGQGRENTLAIDAAAKKATLVVKKPATIPNTFGGVWYSPRKLFDLRNSKYLSVTVSADVPTTVTFDIFDVNNKRYGLLPSKRINQTPQNITFVFDQAPTDAGFDFSKVAAVLLNSSIFVDYNGTITISNLKIGDKADNAPAAKPQSIVMNPIANRTIFSNIAGYTVNLEGVFVVKDAIKLSNAVTLSVTSSNPALIPTPEITNPINGHASIKMKPVAGAKGSSVITVTAKAAGVDDKIFTFNVDVLDKSTLLPGTVTLNGNQTFQTMSGIGTSLYTTKDAEERAGEMGATMLRFDIGAEMQPGLEGLENDNSDPFVLDLSKYKFTPQLIDAINKSKELGCDRFIANVWTPPIWMKGVLAFRPQTPLGGRNRLLKEMYDEFAEYVVGSCLAFKNQFGTEIYSINLQNEAEFESSTNLTATCQYTKEEAAEVVKLVYPRLKALGLATRIHGFDQLPQQGNVLPWLQYFNAAIPNEMDAFSIHAYEVNAINPATIDNATLQSYYEEAQKVSPKKELWMTETSGLPPTAEGARINMSSMFSSFANNVSLWGYFEISKEDVMNFYVHKNFAKFIRNGAVRIGASSTSVPAIAFRHAENKTYTVVLVNTGSTSLQSKLAGMPADFPNKLYAYMTAENINTQLIDSVTASDGYMVNLPPNSIITLYSKFEDVTLANEQADVASMQMMVYPNPTKGEVSVMLPNNSFRDVEVYDITGRLVMTQALKANGTKFESLNLSGLQKGIYIISAKGDINLRSKIMLE
ncbi:MAG TPA: T9SS type A sorting domain-containing protein [Cytophagaceae bacterium]